LVVEIIIIIFSIVVFIDFFSKIGKTIPLLELLITLVTCYYLIFPLILFNNDIHKISDSALNFIGQDVYFLLMTPTIISFFVGVKISKYNKIDFLKDDNKIKIYFEKKSKLIYVCLLIGFLAKFLSFIYVNYFITILTYFIFLSLTMLPYSNIKYKNTLSIFLILYLFIEALQSTVLHSFLIWMIIFYLIFAKCNKIYFLKTFFYTILFLCFIITSNFIKTTFRDQNELKNENLIAKISNYGTLIKKSLPIINENKDIIIYSLISRLSLGDTFAKTISRVPNSISYFNGKLLFEYFWNSFYLNNIYELNTEIKNGEKLRLTDIDKFYFQYFTLEQLNDETTVNLSFIESFYIDFGKVFSILAITIYGFLLGNIYYFFSNKLNIIFFVFFLFLLFPIYLQIEVGMQQVTNYTIKFLLFFLFFKAIIIKFYSKYV